jgi:hypothetical protein
VTSHSGTSANNPRRAPSRTDTADVDAKAASMIGRTFSETEQSRIGDIVSNIVQEVNNHSRRYVFHIELNFVSW